MIELKVTLFVLVLWEGLLNMPCNRLSFAVRVGREVDDIGLFGGFFEPGDHLFFIENRILGVEIILNVNAEPFFRKVANMAKRRVKKVIAPKNFFRVLILAGDSTIMSAFFITKQVV